MMKNIPVYKHTAAYAREHDELAAYRASNQANTACKEAIEAAIKDLEEALNGSDKDAIEAKTTALMTASQKLGEKVYAEAQAAAAAGGAAEAGAEAAQAKPAGTGDDDIVDAEVKEVKK